MKPETNNEMDLLLRRLGRSAADAPKHGDHLDADELSSYAENALPAAARARYTGHLAECASCRKLVAQLSSSAGVVSVAETARVSEPSALRKFLATLFSPMVLRYAVPALGLIVVAVIALTVLRRDQAPESVAQLNEQEQNKAAAVPSAPVQSPAPGGLIDDQERVGSTAATADTRGQRSREIQAAPPPNAPPPAVSVTAEVNQAAPTTKPEEQRTANTAPQPTPGTATDEIKKRDEPEAAKQEVAGRAVSELPKAARERAAEPPKREDPRPQDFAVAEAAPTTGARSKGQGAGIASLQRDGLEKDKKDAETRSVAGRRFRREHGMWIDTAYAAPRSTVSISRGSEQYRALVADEPGIRTIAEELDGEIIVVWKGRPYRIR